MTYEPVSFREKFGKFTERYQPKVIAQMNDYQFKLARVEGEFVWHSHAETDEAFIVLEGALTIEFRDGAVTLKRARCSSCRGASSTNRPRPAECKIMLIEPAGTPTPATRAATRTAPNDVWI